MSQSRLMSLVEAFANVAAGYGLAAVTQIIVFPWFGLRATLAENLTIGAVFSFVSIVRAYSLRRLFERLRARVRLSSLRRPWQCRERRKEAAALASDNSGQMALLEPLKHWIEKRRQIRRQWQVDARRLAAECGAGAYYEAQRLAAGARFSGDRAAFWHWAKAASEVARISPGAEMDVNAVKRIVEEERARGRK